MKKIVKILGIIVVVCIILAVVIRLLLPLVVVKIANRQLPGILHTEASVGSISLGLLRGYVSIRDLLISQPEGFGEGNLLLVPEASVKIKLSSLLNPPLTVEEVVLIDGDVNIVKNKKGVMNIDVILPPPPSGEPETAEKENPPSKPILIRAVSIKNLSCSYTDRAIGNERPTEMETGKGEFAAATDLPGGEMAVTPPPEGPAVEIAPQTAASIISTVPSREGKPSGTGTSEFGEDSSAEKGEGSVLRIRISSFDLLLKDLLIDPAADPAAVEPASAVLTARIVQEPFTDGLLGIAARIGPFGAGIPAATAVLRLADLELKPIAVVVPTGASSVLGGSALDLAADVSLASYLLDCEINVDVSGGHHLALPIGGTPDKPKIDTSSILFGVMLHFGGGLGNLAGNIGGAGYQVGATAAKTTLAVGGGAVNVVGSIGGGLFKTVAGAATGDLDKAAEGLSDTTVGTVNTAGEAAANVAGEAAQGASSTADSTTGEDKDRAWRADTPRRWEKSWSEARESLAAMPFPPPVPEATPAIPAAGEKEAAGVSTPADESCPAGGDQLSVPEKRAVSYSGG